MESLQHSLEEQQRVMTQQLSMERAELERAKVRWGGHLQALFICPVSLTRAALQCVVEETAGCWAAASFLCPLPPQSHTRSHGESQSDQPSGTQMQEAAVCVHDACWFSRSVGPELSMQGSHQAPRT